MDGVSSYQNLIQKYQIEMKIKELGKIQYVGVIRIKNGIAFMIFFFVEVKTYQNLLTNTVFFLFFFVLFVENVLDIRVGRIR